MRDRQIIYKTLLNEINEIDLFKIYYNNNLHFNTAIPNHELKDYLKAMGDGEFFKWKKVSKVLGQLSKEKYKSLENYSFKVGRESSEVIYIHCNYLIASKDKERLNRETLKFKKISEKLNCNEFNVNIINDLWVEFRLWWD